MTVPPFKLYGLFGCPHCVDAEKFLRENRLPGELIVCNDDPIIAAGVKQVTGREEYPILLYRPTKEILVGFKREEYERLAKAFTTLISTSAPNLFSGGQQPDGQVAPEATPVSSGAI